MKATKKITFSAIMAALASVIMLCAYFPYLTYALPALAAIAVALPAIECGGAYGVLTYIVAALITLFTCEPEAKCLFIVVIGYYPLLKLKIDGIRIMPIRALLKFVVFNLSLAVFYFASTRLLGIPANEYGFGFRFGIILMALLADVTFFIYDFALTRLISLYFMRFHDRISKMLK